MLDYCGYEYTSYGALILFFPETKQTVILQGEEATELFEKLENCETQEQLDLIIMEYAVLLEE